MEYELFRSKLKRSVDGALISGIIRSSSSGLNSHRTAVMELMIEGSIQERRERMLEKAKNNPRSDPTPQAKRTSVAPNISIPEAQPLAPTSTPALQPPSQSLPNDTAGTATNLASASAEYEASQDSSSRLKPGKTEGVEQCEEPPVDVKANPSPSEDPVEQECGTCHLKMLESRLFNGACPHCFPGGNGAGLMKCIGCGTIRLYNLGACTGCHRTFK